MSRGDRRENIYQDDVDRQDFLKTLAEMCPKTGFQIHAYCLMSNHFHLVVETPEANLVADMRWLLNSENRQPTPDGKLEESEQQALSGAQDEGAVRQQKTWQIVKSYGLTPATKSDKKEL